MPSMEEYQAAQTQMPSMHQMHYSNGRILVNWYYLKDQVNSLLGSNVYDLGHRGRGFDNFPKYLVIDTRVQQEDGDESLLCTQLEFVTAVKEAMELFLVNLDKQSKGKHPDYYIETKIKISNKHLEEFNARIEFINKRPEFHTSLVKFDRASTGLPKVSLQIKFQEG